MPRFAFALNRPDPSTGRLRRAARDLLGEQARAHKAFLLERGIYRERVWLQAGTGSPPLLLVLWDCDDVEEATQLDPARTGDHERWLLDAVAGGGAWPSPPAGPPVLLSGTTTTATDATGAQTMVGVPIAAGALEEVRGTVARLEDGDLAEDHRQLLVHAGVREQWLWLQPAGDGLPALLLVHWIVDDPSAAWQALATAPGPAAGALRRTLTVAGHPVLQVAGWHSEQLVAMHVRRSDADPRHAGRLAVRLETALVRGRWAAVARLCHPLVRLDADEVDRRAAVDAVHRALGEGPVRSLDTLVGERQLVCVLDRGGDGPMAVVATVRQGLVAGLAILRSWPSAIEGPPAGPTARTPTAGHRAP